MSFAFILFQSLFVIVSVLRTASAALPSGVSACPKTEDLDVYNTCVLQQLEILRPFLATGIPSLKLPAFDPLLLPSLTIDRSLDALKIRANMTQVKVYGVSNYVINELKANPFDLNVELKLTMPHIFMKGEYDVNGRLLLLPLNGVGNFKGNFTNTQVQVFANGKEIKNKNGQQKIEMDEISLKIRVGDGNLKLKTPQSSLTADAAASFFNGNPRLVLDIASPIIEDTAATIGRALVARALGALTKEDLLLR